MYAPSPDRSNYNHSPSYNYSYASSPSSGYNSGYQNNSSSSYAAPYASYQVYPNNQQRYSAMETGGVYGSRKSCLLQLTPPSHFGAAARHRACV